MDPAGQFKSMQETIQAALISTTRSATSLSAGDIPFQRSLDPRFSNALDTQNARLLRLVERLLASAATASNATPPKLPDAEAIDSSWRDVVEVIDSLLEKADTSLDEYTGAVKRLSPAQDPAAVAPKPRQHHPKNIPKPQLSFEQVPRNDESGGFKPLITSKPHAKVPLASCITPYKDSRGLEQYPHPYQKEVESYDYPPSLYEKTDPIPPTPFESTTATWVDTPEGLADMLSELKTAKEIAIDLEHHDNRSYIGIVSLMQISTRNKDWIVDTLKPWRRRLECLNEVFADPAIIKVLHGAYMDIMWLQRDLGLYIVGLFDTFHAARTLVYPGASLAFLLKKFVNFDAQKQYQMADWRIRPLPEDMFKYARADTHFLLFVFDCMRNELIDGSNFGIPDQNKMLQVLEKSRETALQRYEHPIYDAENGLGPMGWYRLISRTPVTYTPEQFSVYKAVHRWRDEVARLEDESIGYVMPNHAIFSLARGLPEDKAAIFQLVQNVSPILRMRADELLTVISAAKTSGKDGPQLISELARIEGLIKGSSTQMTGGETASVPHDAPVPTGLQPKPLVPAVDQPLRADTSQFWGKLLPSSGCPDIPGALSSVTLALPLPPLTAEVFSDNVDVVLDEETADMGDAVVDMKEGQRGAANDVFTVRQLGGSRKRKFDGPQIEVLSSPSYLAPSNQEAYDELGADQIMLSRNEGATRSKRKGKKQRKAVAQAVEKETGLEFDDETGENEVPFNYADAPSVLRGQPKDGVGSKEAKKKKKSKGNGFSPFAKMSDAPKGLPRSQKEGAGRSKTFTS